MWSWISFAVGIFTGGVIGIVTMSLCFIASHNDKYNDKK